MNAKNILGGIAAAVLLFFAAIFAFATNYWPTSLGVSAMLFIVAFVIIYFASKKPPASVIQKIEVSGEMKAASIKCPNCGASVDSNQIKIVSGVPYATCPYCGQTFEVTEEPKW